MDDLHNLLPRFNQSINKCKYYLGCNNKFLMKKFAAIITFCLLVFLFHYQLFSPSDPLEKITYIEENVDLSFDIDESQFSRHPSQEIPKGIFLLILVSSSPHDVEHKLKRDAIRRTWGNCTNLMAMYTKSTTSNIQCRLIFFMGHSNTSSKSLNDEAKTHDDIVMVNHLDEYKTITRKLFLTFLWVSQFKPHYVLKTDDDVFIHVPKLITSLSSNLNNRYLYAGVVYSGSVERDVNHRHYISEDIYAEKRFPAFCKGAFYIYSGILLPSLLKQSYEITQFGVDDAYVGVLMKSLNVTPVYIKEFITLELRLFLSYICDCDLIKLIGIGDGMSGKQILELYERVSYLEKYTFLNSCLHISAYGFFVFSLCCVVVFMILGFQSCRKKYKFYN